MNGYYEILKEVNDARLALGFPFMSEGTVLECATQIYIKQMELDKEKKDDKRREI